MVLQGRRHQSCAHKQRTQAGDRRTCSLRGGGAGVGEMSGVEIVLLCEDQQTNSFVRNFLKHRNLKGHDITTLPLPASHGAGEKWVRERYPKQLKAIRDRRKKSKNIRNKKYVYLIVVIDADTHTLDYRHQQLKQECEENHIPPRTRTRGSAAWKPCKRENVPSRLPSST